MCEAFQATAAERADAVALRTPGDGVSVTWAEYAQRAARIAGGLAALGVERGDTVALMLTNRPEFNVADTGAMHLGATAFSVYNTSTPEQIEFLFGNAANRVVITERAFLPVVRAAQERSRASSTSCSLTGRTGRWRSTGSRRWALRASTSTRRGGRARRRADADLHVRHHRAAEGCSSRTAT